MSLKSHPQLNERWLHEQLVRDPSLLGLGDLEVRDIERPQLRAGRLDMLLYDPESHTRYEVELQLGATDESHIIRTIEYWDIEKRRYPQYEHVAVIIAEDVTSRFLNVVSLFNGFIPIVAIQIQCVQLGDSFTLIATKVVDLMTLGLEEEDEGETVDRSYWEKKASPASLRLVDSFVLEIQRLEPALAAKYNKHYVGLAANGVARNLVTFRPRKQHVIVEFKFPRDDLLAERMEEVGLDLLPYDARWGNFRVRIGPGDIETYTGSLQELIRIARDSYGN